MAGPPSKNIQEKLFRKSALDRLSSPEQLDLMVRITSPAGWVALTALIGLIVVAIMWGIFGNIPTKVIGSAMLIKTGGVVEVSARSNGLITDVSVRAGDMVKRGQKIARIAQPDLLEQFNSLKARKAELQNKSQMSDSLLRQKRETLKFNNEVLRRRLDDQNGLLKDGLITRQSVLTTQQQLEENAAALKELDLRKVDIELELVQIERNLDSVKVRLKLSTDVISPYSGRVLEIKLDENSIVQAGSSILNMELAGDSIKDLEVVVFVSSLDGKKVKPGMDIFISPSTIKREDYGYMVGKVTAVSEFPSTSQGMMRILQNQQLVQQLSAGAAPIQINADLTPDAGATSGYKWTSPGGPPVLIQSGTLGTANISVRSQRPISLVIPMLREFVGV
ncbi:NHLP bacteriocin system secretion protein [Rhodoferax sp. AJA081-3]|uniref:NHLP bacteriocin system secretion protein n=1 Tax=Rhodoferax sp. AJA081-3 TaxID=2752316 RepID=UPI001AE0BEED|nr:NHLP bacteriocin system secretion protein [Rhodoferax sp. AJA081-3]QTN26302.1 NHLP bacteriocin system secretion protein [Rhodoferax sp. AJA081-3]